MSFLSNLRITGKFAVLAGGLGVAIVALGGTGLWAVSALKEDVRMVAREGEAALLAARTGAIMTHIRRLELRVSADRSVNLDAIRREIDGYLADYRRSVERLRAISGPETAAILNRLPSAVETFLAGVSNTLRRRQSRRARPERRRDGEPAALRCGDATDRRARQGGRRPPCSVRSPMLSRTQRRRR
ncbi:MAG: hypothetical protein RML45_01860 [Acetobacteraceae bacterium]|nr:hypothetical protein [Acetobacteraceae bacterium]